MADEELPGPPIGSRLVDLGECEPGKHHVVAIDDDTNVVGTGHVKMLEHGKPMSSTDIVLETDAQGRVSSKFQLGGGDGPAQVATKAYRDNYDTIFGKPKEMLN